MADSLSKSDIISFCFKNGLKVYPVFEGGAWYFASDNNGRQTVYRNKSISQSKTLRLDGDYDERMLNVYKHWYNKIKNIRENV